MAEQSAVHSAVRTAERAAPSTRRAFTAVLAVLAVLTGLHVAALTLFTSGFLLQRVELVSENACTPSGGAAWRLPRPPAGAADGDAAALRAWERALDPVHGSGECTLPPRFDRVVLWIVDSLRYDFVAPPPADPQGWRPDPYTQCHLRTPAQEHARAPARSFLAHFVADAPTTTLQRLKGLTTGSLPTFIEAGANFGGAGRVREDNWIAQLRRRVLDRSGRSANESAGIVFVGDDTWATVFSDLFDAGQEHPYSSFNVEDLDTVDAGVTHHMLAWLDAARGKPQDASHSGNWSLLVAHSLGVDHVGHRFGASHPRMVPKLQQMDRLVRDVLDRMDDRTLFLLMGDHGMDATGDHGGDSELEVGSGVWAYAKRAFDPDARTGGAAAAADVAALLDAQRASSETPPFVPFSPLPSPPYPAEGHRSASQIDLVPTLALLLGVPVPFNNLGAVIPELFASEARPLGRPDALLLRALRINARQVHTYLEQYATASQDLRPFQAELQALWHAALRADARYAHLEHAGARRAELAEAARAAGTAYQAFVRHALHSARRVWAQFDDAKIVLGFLLLVGATLVSAAVWRAAPRAASAEELAARVLRTAAWPAAIGGAAVSLLIGGARAAKAATGHSTPWSVASDAQLVLAGAALSAEAVLLVDLARKTPAASSGPSVRLPTALGAALPVVHALAFASNSLTMWEDRVSLALAALALLARLVNALAAPSTRLQQRMPVLALAALLLLRACATVRVCREEQAPYCTPSFYATRPKSPDDRFADNPAYALSGPATNSLRAIGAAYVAAYAVPDAMRGALRWSRADAGPAQAFLGWVLRPALLAGAAFWLADWAHGSERWGENARGWFLFAKTVLGRVDLALIALLGVGVWYVMPLCVAVRKEPGDAERRERVAVLGYANSLGSAFLLVLLLVFALLFLLAQPMGQLTLAASLVALVMLLELGDHERDVRLLRWASETVGAPGGAPAAADALGGAALPTLPPSLLETSTMALLGTIAFFATGHQATLASIQWRVAFVGFTTVTYPLSPAFVVLNAFGPLVVLPAFGAVLLALWNVAPARARRTEQGGEQLVSPAPMRTPAVVLRTCMGFLLYFSVLAVSAALFAWHFRRHLMLFKIWAPRYMMSGLVLLTADVALMLAVAAAWRVADKTRRLFGTVYA